METAVTYSILQCSTVDGMDIFAQKFKSYNQKIISQKYDPLDYREMSFDSDYDEFKKKVADSEFDLRTFFYDSISKVPRVHQILATIKR